MGMTGPEDYWLYDERVLKAILVVVNYTLQDTGETVHYEWSTQPIRYTDVYGYQHNVEPVIKSFPTISTAIESDASASNLVLQNHSVTAPGGNTPVGTYFDDLLNSPIEGKSIVAYMVDVLSVIKNGLQTPTNPYNSSNPGAENARIVFVGVVGSVSADRETVTLGLDNTIDILDTDIQFTDDDFYSSIEMPSVGESTQIVKPIAYGRTFNVPAVMVNAAYDTGEVDGDGEPITGTLYQVCGTEIRYIWEIRESGNTIYNLYNDWAWGGYAVVDNEQGTFVLQNGTVDGHGTITCDVYGKTSVLDHSRWGPGYPVTNPIPIVLDIMSKVLSTSDYNNLINHTSFENMEIYFDTEPHRYETGIYINQITSALTAINEILFSVRCYLFINEFNHISVGRFEEYDANDTSKTTHVIKQDTIISGSYNLTSCEIPNTKVILTYKKNYTPQSLSDQALILGIKPEDRPEPYTYTDPDWVDTRHIYDNEYLSVIVTNDNVGDYNTAKAADQVDTLIYGEEDALHEATNRMSLRGVKRKIYTLEAKNASIYMRIGDFIKVQHFLYNSSEYISGTIIGLSKDLVNMITTIEVFV